MNEIWAYPAGPKTNAFGSHPGYDEARGPVNPSGDHFISINQVADDVYFDSEIAAFDSDEDDFDEPDDSANADEPMATKEPPPAVFQVHATSKLDSGPTLLAPPVEVTKLCLKEPDPRKRGWRKVPTYLPLTT